jgi:hypothetical protein
VSFAVPAAEDVDDDVEVELWSMTTAVPRSGCGWRVEALHELDEHFLEARLVVVGVLPDECDHPPVTVGSLTVLATGLIDHAEAIVAIVHVGEQQQEIAGGLLGLVELAGADEFGSGVGRDGEFVLVSVLGAGEARPKAAGPPTLGNVDTPPSTGNGRGCGERAKPAPAACRAWRG